MLRSSILVMVLGACATEDARVCEAPTVLRIDRVAIATTTDEALAHAFDLNGDGVRENGLGQVAATLHFQLPGGLPLSATASTRLARDVTWELAVASCDNGDTEITLADGRRVYDHDTDGVVSGKGEGGAVPLLALWDPADRAGMAAGWIGATRSAIELTRDGDRWRGRMAMTVDPEQVREQLAAVFAPYFDALPEDAFFHELFDTAPKDGTITNEEVANHELTRSFLGPDVGDGELSFALAFEAR